MKIFLLILLVSFATPAFSNKILAAYRALNVYNYFKAKTLLYQSLIKTPCEASYGLATIFYRKDNPFSNIDSAAKYIAKSKTSFIHTITLSGYTISHETIDQLMKNISFNGIEKYAADRNISNLNHYLSNYNFSNDYLLDSARNLRDEIYLKRYTLKASSDSMQLFMYNYPESTLFKKAQSLFYNFQFIENTSLNNAIQYKQFIMYYPKNTYVTEAEYKLFELTKELHSADSMYTFIKKYSCLTKDEAWKMLYSLSVKEYSKNELDHFLKRYPEYPYSESIQKEIVLSQHILYPIKHNNDKYGYIDTLGKWIINPVFDDAGYFKEGFAWVCKDDSCFYINKEGVKTSVTYFEETEDYENGLAIVKKQNYYFLINRSGQLITNGFDDINKASENLFVCKKNNLYGAINPKGEIVIPFNYQKLGNFKNNYAYYISDKYGLVNIYNQALKPQWDWISEIDTNNLVIVKKDIKFGLMQLNETLLLVPDFDYIRYCENGIYMVVKNNLYGFYNAQEKCFITAIAYDYNKSFSTSYYTNGKQFKLIKDENVAMVDANGKISILFGTYTDFFFAKNDVIRIMKGKKFGYMDRKLKPITSAEFEKASDFENNLAIVSKTGITHLINKIGKTVFTLKDGNIERSEHNYYMTEQNDLFGLINSSGEILLNNEFNSLHYLAPDLWSVTKNKDLYLYKVSTKTLIRL